MPGNEVDGTMPRGGHVSANGIRLHYIEYPGKGPPLLLLPGITSPAITWGFVAERLAANNHVFVLDNRGRGLSSGGPGLTYTADDYAADAMGTAMRLGLDRPVLLGHSMGARIGARFAARYPDSLSKLILADPPVSGPGRRPYPTPLEPYLNAMELASRGAPIGEFRKLNPTWTDEQLTLRMEWLPTCTFEAVVESHRSFHTEDLFADLPLIRCPTLLVVAARAPVITDADAREIIGLIRDVRTARVEAGHMMPWDNLEGFLSAVTEFAGGR
jgi:N-formylmaleamate deformylase